MYRCVNSNVVRYKTLYSNYRNKCKLSVELPWIQLQIHIKLGIVFSFILFSHFAHSLSGLTKFCVVRFVKIIASKFEFRVLIFLIFRLSASMQSFYCRSVQLKFILIFLITSGSILVPAVC